MAFNEHECDWRRARARHQTGGLQETDELESFREELLRAIAPLEYRMSPKREHLLPGQLPFTDIRHRSSSILTGRSFLFSGQ
jgi:hypothetical protein